MKRLVTIGVLAVIGVVLAGCGQLATRTTLAADESAPSRGGGGGVTFTSNGVQFTEGVVVVGSGTASAEPEVALVTFGVELRGDSAATLVDEGATKIEDATAQVQELGVGADDIRTTGYSLWVENIYDPERGTPTGEVVFHLNHQVEVTLRNLDQVGELLAAVVEAGVNTISGVNFTVEDPGALIEQARQEALQDAAARAQQMADELGITLDAPVLVSEGGGYPVGMGVGGGGGMVEVAAPGISPGTFSVSVSVQVVYGIR